MIKFVVVVSLVSALTLAQMQPPKGQPLKRVARQMSGVPSNLAELPGMGINAMENGARAGLGMMNPETWLNEGKKIMENPAARKRRAAQQMPGEVPPMPDGMGPQPPVPPVPGA